MQRIFILLTVLLALSGCTTLKQGGDTTVSPSATWAVLPFMNNTETPYASEKSEAITAALLFSRGITRIEQYPAAQSENETLMDRGVKRRADALAWAKKQNIRYAVTGSVNEWRYKVGLDGEPVAGFTLQLLEFPEGKVLWSASAGKSGWSRDAVSSVAQQVIEKMLDGIQIQ